MSPALDRGRHWPLCAALTALTVLSAGCAVGPNYERPLLDVPPSHRFAETAATTGTLVETVWWSQFGDTVLDELVARAIAENNDILIALARVEEYYGRVMTVRAGGLPQVSAQIGAARQRSSGSEGTSQLLRNPYNSVQAGAFASWELDLFGRIRRLTESARAQWIASAEARRSTEISVAAAVASGYITLRDLDNRLAVAGETLDSRLAALQLFQDRYQGGVVSELEVAQAESEVAGAQTSVALYRQLIAQQEHLLSSLLGDTPGPIPRGKSIIELTSIAIPADLPSALIERRPDILEAEQILVAANAEIGAARALYFPSISLTGLFGAASTALSGLWSSSARTWSYGASVALPLFTGGGIAGEVMQAEARRTQAIFAYRRTVETAFREVSDALVGVSETRQQLAAKDRQVNALSRYATFARDRYEGGYTSYLEVLDSERELFSAQLDQSSLRGNELSLIVDLYKALGAGWPTQPPAQPDLAEAGGSAAPAK
ncbi:efflux transporter outer membrane subunit [Paracidovorax citrulli]